MKDIQQQQPFSNYNISNEKPNVPRTKKVMTGWIANSMNGGHIRPITWKKIMAGEFHDSYTIRLNIKMLTPLSPVFQNLKGRIIAAFVPNKRVWDDADKYTAQRGGASDPKPNIIPNLGGQVLPIYPHFSDQGTSDYMNTTVFRDSFASSYLPRMGQYINPSDENREAGIKLPAINVLPLRGVVAIYNDFFRSKEYDAEITEYKGSTVSLTEMANYIQNPQSLQNVDYYQLRAKRPDNYWTDYRTELQGFELQPPQDIGENEKFALQWAAFESKFAEMRSQAENANKTDAEIIAEIRGSKLLTEGRVEIIGAREFNINYAAITQTSYNANENIEEKYQVMGQQGAYSYTEINLPIYANQQFNEEGFLHIFIHVYADSVFESAIDRNLMNITPLDEYRPDLEGDKLDVIYEYEFGTERSASVINNGTFFTKTVGFKRKYTELEKLPNVISGDLTSKSWDEFIINLSDEVWQFQSQLESQKTFQFFENDAAETIEYENATDNKQIWKDYTDLLINKNLAIPFKVYEGFADYAEKSASTFLDGNNQIFFVGQAKCVCTLPMNNGIENNKTGWGEH